MFRLRTTPRTTREAVEARLKIKPAVYRVDVDAAREDKARRERLRNGPRSDTALIVAVVLLALVIAYAIAAGFVFGPEFP